MLPATLVTLVTFLLDLSNSSPVYNMQPAFITTNIGPTNGRNIRNLPCISRKNNGLSGVCMFAIDCLKANGTHLGTCIDRFYFGSCCHIEPIKDVENSIETNIILDSREPPERLHNTTLIMSSTTQTSFSSSSTTNVNKLSQQDKRPSSSTTEINTTTNIITSTKPPRTNSSTRPFGDKFPLGSSTSSTSTTEITTTAQKLQTFQLVDGSLVETTTFKYGTTKRPSAPVRTSTKLPSTTTKPRPAITAPSKPYQRPSRPSSSSSKPSSKPTKPISSSKPTQKPSKPVRVSSTTRRPQTTTTSRTTSTKRTTTKPTRKVTRPSGSTSTTGKPVTTSRPSVRTTTTKAPTRKPPVILTKKPPVSITTSPSTTMTASTKPTVNLISEIPVSSTTTTILPATVSTVGTSTTLSTEESVSKENITQILESGTVNLATNEVIETTSTIKPIISTTTTGPSSVPTSSMSSLTSSFFKPTTNISAKPSIVTSTTSGTTTTKPPAEAGLITWTIDDSKNHTVAGNINETIVTANITEEWVPITTPDGWVLLPSVTAVTTSPIDSKNETTYSSTVVPSTSAEPLSTFIPLVPEISSSTEIPSTTLSSASISTASSNTTSSPSTSTTVLTSDGEKLTTTLPSVTDMFGNATSTETSGSTTTVETTSSGTSTEVVSEGKPVNMSDFTDVCGRRMWPEARIVGGEKSTFGKWPWQISLRQWRTSTYLHKCGAALLNENWAITAAHCVDTVPPSDLLLRLGEHDLSTEGEPYLHEERRVQIVASHPQFDPRTFEYDLALLRFYEPVQFQPNILPVCVPKTDENFVGRTAHVTGWGRLYEDGPLPSILQEVSVPVINNSVCESMYRSAGYIEHIPHIFICAGWRRGGFDSCEGDSGGPMVIQREDKRFLLAGVISWGIGCAEPNQPGVYTRISEFRDWINQILQF